MRGFLTVTALAELSGIVRSLDGEAHTPYCLAGLGDLITTATSAGSHHHELGRRIAPGERSLDGEGIQPLQVLRAHPRFSTDAFPLFRMIDDCVRAPQDPRQRFSMLLSPVT